MAASRRFPSTTRYEGFPIGSNYDWSKFGGSLRSRVPQNWQQATGFESPGAGIAAALKLLTSHQLGSTVAASVHVSASCPWGAMANPIFASYSPYLINSGHLARTNQGTATVGRGSGSPMLLYIPIGQNG
jgi:hypothetical protein